MGRSSRQATRLHQLRAAVESRLLDIVKNGRHCFDGDGRPVLDEAGEHLRRPPSAADINAAVKWLSACGAVHSSDKDRPDTVAQLVASIQQRKGLTDSRDEPIPFPGESEAS